MKTEDEALLRAIESWLKEKQLKNEQEQQQQASGVGGDA